MSTCGNQKVKRNVASPSSSSASTSRQGPLRATQQFVLVNGSPSRKQVVGSGIVASSSTSKANKSSSAKTRSHSETAFVSDRRSPTSPVYNKVEKPKALRATGSVDNINLYLSGQWPKDVCKKSKDGLSTIERTSPSYYSDGVYKKDTHTQTPEEWDGDGRRPLSHSKLALYKRSKSVGSGDNWSLKSSKDIKAKLQRKDGNVKGSQSMQRFSPVPVITTNLSLSTQPIKIPVPVHDNGVLRGTPGKARASAEGHNQEIERLIKLAMDGDDESQQFNSCAFLDHPDGHRAPVPEVLNTRNADTQTAGQTELFVTDRFLELGIGNDYGSGRCSRASTETDDGSRPQSVSPSPFMLGPLDIDEPSVDAGDSMKSSMASANSPRPNKSAQFVRLPPDGAEKLKSVVEVASGFQPKHLSPPAIMSTVNLQPSECSAFSSLGKPAQVIIPSRSPVRFVEELH